MRASHAAMIVCLAICGCGKSAREPKALMLPVKGTVTLDGKPLAGANVVFMTGIPPMVFVGTTKDDGAYQLQCLAGREASLQGESKVTISRLLKPDGSPLAPGEAPADVGAVEQLPPKYSQFDVTTLSKSVPAEGGTFDFALESK